MIVSSDVRWMETVPKEVRDAVEPLLRGLLWLLPPWLTEFSVDWDESEVSCLLKVNASYRYRWAVLSVCPRWLREPEADRSLHLVHELVHVLLEPYASAVSEVVEATTKVGTPERVMAEAWLSEGLESATEDVAVAVTKMIPTRLKVV